MLNAISISGRLGRAPELRDIDGTRHVRFSLAVDRDYKDKQTGYPATDWIPVEAWRQTADFAGRYLDKGSSVIVNGRLCADKFVDRNGDNRVKMYVLANSIYFAGQKPTAAPQPVNLEEVPGGADDGVPF